jgi:hypothetical protein
MKAVGRFHQPTPWRKLGIRGPGGSAMGQYYPQTRSLERDIRHMPV